MLKGPKEALLFFLFLAWNQKQKTPNGTKIVQGNKNCAQGNKKCAREQKMFLKSSVVHFGIEVQRLPCMV